MRKIYSLLFTLCTLFTSHSIHSQDFNLFNPSNEMYLFSAFDEGANAFRYNPAVLGLKHRLNATVNAFLINTRNKVRLTELDFAFNAGNFGLAYRSFVPDITNNRYSKLISSYTIGFGVGNKTFSSGLLFELINKIANDEIEKFDYKRESKLRFGFGLLYRPTQYLSTSFSYRTYDAFFQRSAPSASYTLGLAIRPLKKDLITLMSDLTVTPYAEANFFKYTRIKSGAEVRFKGFGLGFNYQFLSGRYPSSFYNVAVSFNFPHSTIKYSNTFSRFDKDSYYDKTLPIKSTGNHVSLTFNSENRESIIPKSKKILEISLSGTLQDYNTEDVFFGLLGNGKRSVHEVIADIDYAADDESITGLLIKIYPLSTGRFEINANIEELGAAMERFRKKGKSITAYLTQSAGPGEFYLATFANDIVLPEDTFLFYGLSIDVTNYKQFLAKYGIDLNTFYAGKYKLTFQGLLDSTSEEGREVINRMLDVIYEKMMNRVVVARNITLDDYMREKLSMPLSGREAKRLGLIDINGWYDDAKELAMKNSKTNNIIFSLNRSEWDNEWSEPDAIAIVGVYGSITTGESQPPTLIQLPIPFISGGRSTGSESVVRQLEDAFANPKVKAVILRVESGGGDATASAEINAAVIRLKKKYGKPFIVSMGGAAASGGYFVSTSADKIFTDDLTITGSIGVFFVKPNIDSLLDKQKIRIQTFSRGEHSDMETYSRKPTKEEVEIIQNLVDYSYDNFITAVSKGRNMTKEEVDAVAQGRVWLGSDAFNKKLVDEIGGLYEAIKYSKKKAGIVKRMKLIYYAVPGGNVVNQLVTSSVVSYLQTNLLKMLGFDEEDNSIDIQY